KESYFKIFIWLSIGAVALFFCADWLVGDAVVVAKEFGVSEAVISVSLVALGTSVPELAASIIAIVKKEKALSLGNLIGSNIFNIGSVLGLTGLVESTPLLDPKILSRDVLWMLVFAIILLPLILITKRHKLQLKEGLFLVFLYAFFMLLVFK
ncbi:MAG: sodium:calcium antiporter, partial [Bacteroidota bacterium]|nr:sodium:calcium antiporter [Bacteroidota bacterium]